MPLYLQSLDSRVNSGSTPQNDHLSTGNQQNTILHIHIQKMFAVIAYIIRRLIDSYLMPQITYTTGVLITLIPETLCSVRVLWEYFQLKLFFSVSSPWGQNWHCTYTTFIYAHGKNTLVSILSFLCYNLRSPVEIPTGMQSEWRWTTNNENFKYSPKESSG